MKKKGRLIIFEGGEGGGKTTQMKLLARRLKQDGFDIIITKEPGGTKIGGLIRQVFLNYKVEKVEPLTELFLLLADRAQHCHNVIIPGLESGKVVLCDRFTGSTLAYQLGGRGLAPAGLIKKMEARSRYNLKPDLVILLDVKVEEGLKRKYRNKTEKLNRLDKESEEFHKKVRKYFLSLAEREKNWVNISSVGSVKEINQKIYGVVKKFL